MFEKSTRLKLRFKSNIGNLTTEDLWDLSLTNLNSIAKQLNKVVKESEEEDFLKESTKQCEVDKLKFDIVLHILNTKKDEKEQAEKEHENKKKKQRLIDILDRKRESNLENLTEEEILKQIQEL